VNSGLPLKDITLESVNPGGVGLGFNPQDSRGVDHTTLHTLRKICVLLGLIFDSCSRG
jgi:hypothetical protein